MSIKLKICINADDYGFSSPISKGIIHLVKNDIVSSVSIMSVHAIKEDWDEINCLSNKTSIGLHFSLTSGRNKYIENYHTPYLLMRDVLIRKISYSELFKELEYQYNVLKSSVNANVSHIDTHQHIHLIPAIKSVLEQFQIEKGIPYIRIGKDITRENGLKKLAFNTIFQKTNIDLFGLCLMGKKFNKKTVMHNIDELIKSRAQKIVWIVHPGYRTEEFEFNDPYNIERNNELNLLLIIKNELMENFEICKIEQLLK